jgi:hypothetical protein
MTTATATQSDLIPAAVTTVERGEPGQFIIVIRLSWPDDSARNLVIRTPVTTTYKAKP